MSCPITFRTNGLGIKVNEITFKELRLEHNWKICRHLIVFIGSLLTMIYGLLILISINWFINQSFFIREQLRQITSIALSTGVCLIVVSSFGCTSVFLKSQFKEFLENFKESRAQNEREVKIVRYSGDDPQTMLGFVVEYLKGKLNLLKRCFILSPIFTLNAVLITSLIPFEFSVVKKCINYMLIHRKAIKFWHKRQTSDILLVLCLNVFFMSVILVQFIVFIYFCDLINTSLDKQLRLKQYKLQELSRRRLTSPEFGKQLQNRTKNILFHQFLYQKNSQKSSPKGFQVFPKKSTRSGSTATTITISDGQLEQTPNDYVELYAQSSYL